MAVLGIENYLNSTKAVEHNVMPFLQIDVAT
jgi:hypothetical protein